MEQIVQGVQDMTYLSWSLYRNSSGTAGSFLKSQEITSEGKIYYKLSRYDARDGVIGHESVNEIIADRLLTILDIPHIHYRLIHADILLDEKPIRTWLCSSLNFRQHGEKKHALDDYYRLGRLNSAESPLDFCIRNGWSEYIYQMLVFDYLILNRDRHGANIEVLENRYRKTIRLAPLFDNGVSLYSTCLTKDDLDRTDAMEDRPVQCFVGSRSAWENLKLIPHDRYPILGTLHETDRSRLLDGLEDALDPVWLKRCWDMIWRRWQAYEAFRNQR